MAPELATISPGTYAFNFAERTSVVGGGKNYAKLRGSKQRGRQGRGMGAGEIDIDAALFKVDVYSFALLLWALWMRQEPYMHSGLNAFQLVQRVLDGVRPPMPPSMPPKMAQLVRDCWAGDPDARPSFTEIRKRLKDMRGDFFG